MIVDTDNVDANAGAMIMRNIEIFQAAYAYSVTTMRELLQTAVFREIDNAIRESGWDGFVTEDLDDRRWLSAKEWRTSLDGTDYRHLVHFEIFGGGDENTLWLSEFAGVGGGSFDLHICSEPTTKRKWKAIVKQNEDLMTRLRSAGFTLTPDGDLYMPINFDREALAQGFADEDLSDAMRPLADALQHLIRNKDLLDDLCVVVRKMYDAAQ